MIFKFSCPRLRKDLLTALLVLSLPVAARAANFTEYQVKAEFLARIAEFVEWPKGTFAAPDAPFLIAVAGEDPFGPYLEKLARSKKIQGHPVVLRRLDAAKDLVPCHLLFIAGSEGKRLEEILDTAGKLPVLIVGDMEGFARRGVHVALYRADSHIRFNVNLRALRRSGLLINSQLLRLAGAIYGGDKQ